MKKLAAILLLAIFAFNLFGYKLWSYFAEQQAHIQLTQKLDSNNYNEEDLLLVTKPVNLPYYNNTTDFTSAEGETEINGVIYRYVKYRINNNQLEMLCLPDNKKTNIREAKNNYFSLTADIEKKGDDKGAPVKGNNLKKGFSDFEENKLTILNTCVTGMPLQPYPNYLVSAAGLQCKAVAEQPPELFI